MNIKTAQNTLEKYNIVQRILFCLKLKIYFLVDCGSPNLTVQSIFFLHKTLLLYSVFCILYPYHHMWISIGYWEYSRGKFPSLPQHYFMAQLYLWRWNNDGSEGMCCFMIQLFVKVHELGIGNQGERKKWARMWFCWGLDVVLNQT